MKIELKPLARWPRLFSFRRLCFPPESKLARLAGSAADRREQADLEAALALSSTDRPLAPPPPSVYPSLHGTLASDSTPSATIDRPSSDQHQTRSEQSSNAASANNNKRLVSSNAGQQSARAHPGDASLEGISSCSTLPRPRKLPFPAGHDATAGTVSEIQSFSSSSLRHSGGVAMQYLQQDEPLGDALLADSENEREFLSQRPEP